MTDNVTGECLGALVADDEEPVRKVNARVLGRLLPSYEVLQASTAAEARAVLDSVRAGTHDKVSRLVVILSDNDMETTGAGLQFLQDAKVPDPQTTCAIICSGLPLPPEDDLPLIQTLSKPFSMDELREKLEEAGVL